MSPLPHILILVEGKSEENFLRNFLPFLGYEEGEWRVKQCGGGSFFGKIRAALRQWKMPGTRKFVVLRDQDLSDCGKLRADIREWVKEQCPVQFGRLSVAIACRELEAWYLGDLDALWGVYPNPPGEARRRVEKYRKDPDGVPNPSDVLKGIAVRSGENKRADFPKLQAAFEMGKVLGRKCAEDRGDGFGGNRSPSFRYFVRTMRDALKELREAQGGGSP